MVHKSAHSSLRKINQRRIIESVLRLRRTSRAHLARVSGISAPTVSRIVDDLLNSEILMEASGSPDPDGEAVLLKASSGAGGNSVSVPMATAVGRPSQPLELDDRRARFLAIQLGVHRTRLARTPMALPEDDKWEIEFPTPASADAWSELLARHAARLPIAQLEAVVISVPGVVEESTGRVFLSPNLRWTETVDLGQIIGRVVARGARVVFVQEIRALALGHLSAAPEAGDFLLIDFGTGVGAAAVTDRRLYISPLPLSGEIGHTPVLGNTRPCGCGSVGCVETLVSQPGLLASGRRHQGIEDWQTLIRHIETEGIPDWMKVALDATAVCIAASLNVLGLRQVVLTGCIAELPRCVIDHLGTAIRQDAMWARFGSIGCHISRRRRLAGMIHSAIARTLLTSLHD